jgi:hypothetical protein
MKKVVLFVFGFISILATKNASAQSFTLSEDTVRMAVNNLTLAEPHAELTNTSPSSMTYEWKLKSSDFPDAWKNFGICDNRQCFMYTNPLDFTILNESLPVATGGKFKFKIQMDVSTIPSGMHYITASIWEKGAPAEAKDVTFILGKWGTNVGSVSKNDDVTIYPNPAKTEINVLFNPNAGIKNISVYNLIGKVISVYKVQGSSAKLDLQSIPPGIYFMRLSDNQGRVVATRKFTHQ